MADTQTTQVCTRCSVQPAVAGGLCVTCAENAIRMLGEPGIILEAYMFASTPDHLYRQLRRCPEVKELAK